MKSRITDVLVLSCFVSMGGMALAQNAPIDFESAGYGADWTWTSFENDTNIPLAIVANPSATGINISATVASFTALTTGAPWAGCESQHGSDIGPFSFDETNCTVKVMVYKSVISDVGIKFAEASSDAQPEVKVANTLINEWEELTFDLSGSIGAGATGIVDQIIVFPDFDLVGRTSDNTVYFDNITFSGQAAGPDEPEISASTPTHDPANVISLFSNAYSDVTVDTWSAAWDVADVADVQVAGDDVKLYTGLVYAGIEFTSLPVDASDMTHFHMDIWTPDPSTDPAAFRVKLVDFGADAAYAGGDDSEHELSFTAPILMTGSWIAIDVPMTDFAALAAQGHLAQLIISGDPNTVYVDNVYFYSSTTGLQDEQNLNPDTFTLEQNFPNPFNPETSIRFSLIESGRVVLNVYNIHGQQVAMLINDQMPPGPHTIAFNGSELPSGSYFYSLVVGSHTAVQKMLLIK
ncbi:T9SS type A sorting domain-containing protein [bacterium]|nr:T9SS type A sorting domain-containing protein [bacterium]